MTQVSPALPIAIYRMLWYICTMSAKKELPASAPVPAYRKELKYLYARRFAVDTLIESLKTYDRFRETRTEEIERQTA